MPPNNKYNDPPWFKMEEDPNGTLTYSGSMKQIADSMTEILTSRN